MTKTRQLWVRPWVVNTLTFRDTSGLIVLYFIWDIYMLLMNSTYEVRLILVYTYEHFCNFFVHFDKKHHYPPPFNSQNKTPPDVQRRKSFCREIRHIYTYCMRSTRRGVFVIVCSRLSEPQWPLKIRRHGHFKGVLVLVIYHLVALVELLAAMLRVRTQERACDLEGITRTHV